MNGKIVVYIIALVCIVMFIMQILAIFLDEAYIKWDREIAKFYNYYLCNCGVFDCDCNYSLRKAYCGTLQDHIKAACAFGILTIIWIAVSMIVHLMLCFAKTSGMILGNNLGVKFVNYMWVWHLISALFNLICWACLAGAYDRELCGGGWKLKNSYDLAWGFFVLVIITVVDAILAFVCWKHMHVYYSYSSGGGGGGRRSGGPPPGYYESNPIDRQGFQGRRY